MPPGGRELSGHGGGGRGYGSRVCARGGVPAAVRVPAVRRFVLDHFTDRLATTMALVEEVAFRRLDQRAARWLADQAEGGGVIALSHQEIAGHLGTARVVVSRILGEFESRGWVRLGRRRVEVTDPAALRAFGNQSD